MDEFFKAAADAAANTDYLLQRARVTSLPSHVTRLEKHRAAEFHKR
jgi:hypothetical protein